MELFNPYLPLDRRYALSSAISLPDQAWGAVLFADIAGFTPLTATLASELGKQRGAEELTRQLNRVLAELIGRVHAHQGSVINFSGDSITCWFDDAPPVNQAEPPSGARRATACAFAMQRAMEQFRVVRTPANTQVSLVLKVAVAAGAVRRFLVGQPETRLVEVLAGRLLDRVAAAESAARQGEIIVGAELLGQFGSLLTPREWRSDSRGEFFAVIDDPADPTRQLDELAPSWPWPTNDLPEAATAEQWLLPVLRQRLREGQDAFLAELRQAVAVFLSFGGIDYDADRDAHSKLDSFVRWVQRVLSRFEGELVQVTIGDKGSYLYIVFGALVAHEDDATRAVAAAQTLLNPPEQLSFIQRIRIGLSQGTMYTGAYGAPNRRTFGVQGNETNIAARLMGHAQPGQLVVSAQVAQINQHVYAFQDLGAVALKGVSGRLPIFAVVGQHRREAADLLKGRALVPIIGRERERQALADGLKGLQAGRSQTVIIEGEAGIGKSRLIMAFLEMVNQVATPFLLSTASAIERSTAYYAWRPIFRQLFHIEEEDSHQIVRQQLAAKLGSNEELNQLAPLLNAVLPLSLPESELTKQMSGEARANSTRSLLIRLLAESYDQARGLVLVFEDAQWLDSASWALIAQVRQTLSPLMTVIVARPGSPIDEYQRLSTEPEVQKLELGVLSPQETAKLVCLRLGVQELPTPVASFIQQQAEGHPFFSEEIAYALRDAGHLRIQNDRAYLAEEVVSLRELDFPATIQGVITSRIDRLETKQQLTLKVASVIGRLFALRILEYLYPASADRPRLPDYLEMLSELDIILPEIPEPDLAYLFKHSITHEVVYKLMTYSQRRQLHRLAAEWYEQRYGDDLSPHYSLLAHHWSRSDETDKALYYLDLAGQQALRNFANAEAITFFTEALALDDSSTTTGDATHPRRARWELQLGEAYVHWTRYQEGRQHLERGLRLLGKPVPQRAEAVYAVGAILRQLIHRAWPGRLAVKSEEQRALLLDASRAYARLVEVYYHLGEVAASIQATFHSLNLAERAGDSAELAEAYAPVASFFSFLRRHGTAQAYFHRALDTAQRVNSLPALAYVSLVKATYDTGIGNWADAETSIERLSDIGLQLGAKRRYNDGLQLLTILQYTRGEFKACLSTAEQLLISARQLDDLRFQGYALYAFAHAHFYLGDLALTQRYLDDLQTAFTTGSGLTDEQLALNMHGLNGLLHLQQGKMAKGLAAVEQAFQLTSGSLQTSYYTLPGYIGPVAVYLAQWAAARNDDQARRRAKQALRALARFAGTFPMGRPSTELYQGDFQRLAGNRPRAIKHWQAALTAAEQLDLVYEMGQAHYRLGCYPPEEPALQRDQHLQTARQCFEQVGARNELAATMLALDEDQAG